MIGKRFGDLAVGAIFRLHTCGLTNDCVKTSARKARRAGYDEEFPMRPADLVVVLPDPKSWSKDEEALWLDAAIAELGPHSYLGPWLSEYRADIRADILNDVCVDLPLPSAARREAAEILSSARAEAARIIGEAEERAKKTKEDAWDRVQQFRESAKRTLMEQAGRI